MSKSQLKILHVIPNLAKGGAERLCLDICQQFIKMGAKVKLVAFEDNVEYVELLKGIDYRVFNLLNSISIRNSDSPTMQSFKNYVNKFSPDIVHTHLFGAELIWKLTKIPIQTVFHIHDNIKSFSPFEIGFSKKDNWIKYYEKLSYKRLKKIQPTHFLSISKDTNAYIKKKLKLKSTEVTLLFNSINRDLFLSEEPKNLDALKLITIGSLVTNKGHFFLINLVSALKKMANKNIELIILGDGPLRDQILLENKSRGLDKVISLLGNVDNPEYFLKQANFYVHGSFKEAFGLVLMEAMASGLPVFTTDGYGNRDLIHNGENGFIYFERDAVKMAKDILTLYNSPGEYDRIRLNAIEFSKNFDVKDYGNKLDTLYRSLLN
tara:strand:- start:1130 stop:2263 length:1134 start_codon:yes stop_codon:yes gene_type:complete